MPPDDGNDRQADAARRFARSEAEKASRLRDVKARLTVGEGMRASPSDTGSAPRTAGWLGPALFWTAFIGLGSLAASHWLSASRGDTGFRVLSGDVLELQIGRSGHYEVPGAVASAPVRFIVDTGATLTSIPGALGERIGIRACPSIGFDLSAATAPGCCRPETFHTANGIAEGCVARVPSLRFGDFELRNASVAVMPGMNGQALLGMNVLRHFSLVQQGGRLTVARKAGE